MNRWGVLEAHWHCEPLIQAKWSSYSSEMYVIQVHLGLEKGVCHVQFGPDPTFGLT